MRTAQETKDYSLIKAIAATPSYIGDPLLETTLQIWYKEDMIQVVSAATKMARRLEAAERLASVLSAIIATRVVYEDGMLPPPHTGHDCEWCGDCVKTLRGMERNALAAWESHSPSGEAPSP